MTRSAAYKALFVALLGLIVGCGDASDTADWEGELDATTEKVVGGWAATSQQIFATVEIRHVWASAGFCSGTLIAPRLVVTAAHCAVAEPEPGVFGPAMPSSLRVVGGHLASRSADPSMMRSVVQVSVHEGYDHEFVMGRSRDGAGQGGIGSPNDIALLVLSEPFEELPNAPMLTAERERELVRDGDVAFVAGYGVYDLEDKLSGELYISDAIIDIIGDQELLTRRSDQLGDSCYGDSGGPLYVPTEEGDFLLGLVSRGRSDVKRDCGDGGVYTLLSAYLPWIEETAGHWFDPIEEPGVRDLSFLEDGADPVSVPKGGALRGAGACAASSSASGGESPVSIFVVFLLLVVLRRSLSQH